MSNSIHTKDQQVVVDATNKFLARLKLSERDHEDLDAILHVAINSPNSGVFYRLLPYPVYLETEHWRTKRNDCLGTYHGKCALCNSKNNVQVHHRTYKNIGREERDDLTLLCEECHNLFHQHRKAELQRGSVKSKEPKSEKHSERIKHSEKIAAAQNYRHPSLPTADEIMDLVFHKLGGRIPDVRCDVSLAGSSYHISIIAPTRSLAGSRLVEEELQRIVGNELLRRDLGYSAVLSVTPAM